MQRAGEILAPEDNWGFSRYLVVFVLKKRPY